MTIYSNEINKNEIKASLIGKSTKYTDEILDFHTRIIHEPTANLNSYRIQYSIATIEVIYENKVAATVVLSDDSIEQELGDCLPTTLREYINNIPRLPIESKPRRTIRKKERVGITIKDNDDIDLNIELL